MYLCINSHIILLILNYSRQCRKSGWKDEFYEALYNISKLQVQLE